jgi:GntR family transcriptional regulator, arabinose operon transcriptional repressor
VLGSTKHYRSDLGPPREPKYRQIKRHLLNQLRSGVFGPGDALPKERELAVSLDVASGTLRQALQELEADGLIRRVRGQGTFATTAKERQALVRAKLFSLILPQVREDLYSSLIHGIEQAMAGTGYQVTVGNSCNELTRQEQLIHLAIENNVSGVAIVPTTFPLTPREQIRPLVEHHIPLVFCNRPVEGVAAPLVTWSGHRAGQLIGRTLLEKGHRRIVTLVAYRDPMMNATTEGVAQALCDFGLPSSAYRVHYHGERVVGPPTRKAIRQALAELLVTSDRPTAIHCAGVDDAEQVFLLAGEMGLSVPRDLSVICEGDGHPAGGLAQRLTCLAIDAQAIGFQAGRLLAHMNSGQDAVDGSQRIEVSVTLLTRETVGPPPEDMARESVGRSSAASAGSDGDERTRRVVE